MGRDDRILRQYTLGGDEAPSEGVYSAVTAVEDCSPLDLTPIAGVIDPDSLDALFTRYPEPNRISFEYCGYEVAATRDEIRVLESRDR